MLSKNVLARLQNETWSRRVIDIETCSSGDGRKNMAKRRHRLARSSGNVFRDLGFSPEESEHLQIRADLMIQIEKVLKERGLKQAQAAKLLRVTQPRVSDLLRGRIDLFSTDTLIDMLARLGIRVRLVTRRLRPSRVV
jgi:predicted XRE-type DNA-binding protein